MQAGKKEAARESYNQGVSKLSFSHCSNNSFVLRQKSTVASAQWCCVQI